VVGLTRPEGLALGAATRAASRLQKFERDRVIGDAHRQAVEARRGQQRHRTVLAARQHQGQRTRPDGCRQTARPLVEIDQPYRFVDGGHMDDQRIEAGPALGGEDRRHGAVVGGVAPEAVNGLCGEGD
jgi:hypothetical protein